MSDDTRDITTLSDNELLDLALDGAPAPTTIGRMPTPMRQQDMAPAVIKNPVTVLDRIKLMEQLKLAGEPVPSDLALEFATMAGDGSGITMNDDGEEGYADDIGMAIFDGTGYNGGDW